jgi:uncharacterized protein YeaO (DUF488 family)
MPARRARGKTASFRIKRIYDAPAPDDGKRILVDRLWPRGISKDRARLDQWLRDVAPSDSLRQRVHGDPGAWEQFVFEYSIELGQEPAASAAKILLALAHDGPVTLLYGARDTQRNNAVALQAWLERQA